MRKTFSDGFTLIELLTVMSIIAILAAISIFALAGARESGRDARRKADLEAVAGALELLKSDCNYYPATTDFPTPGSQLTGGSCGNTNIYMESVPADPLAGQDYTYEALGCGANGCTRFIYWTALEDPGATPAVCSSPPSCGSATCNYCVTNP